MQQVTAATAAAAAATASSCCCCCCCCWVQLNLRDGGTAAQQKGSEGRKAVWYY